MEVTKPIFQLPHQRSVITQPAAIKHSFCMPKKLARIGRGELANGPRGTERRWPSKDPQIANVTLHYIISAGVNTAS